MEKKILLAASNLVKKFPGVKALDDVEFCLEEGSIHALCGENGAGKSTLMKILMGVYRQDSGEITVKGSPVDFRLPKQALASGIAIIEQELNPIPEMTVAENMFLGRENTQFGFWMDYRKMKDRAVQIFEDLETFIDPAAKMKNLSLAQVQIVEIAKALSYDSDIIIMDEPTSAIGEKDVERFFNSISLLKAKGKGIIYISHRMQEIFTISDTITVLRDGRYIGTHATSDITQGELVQLMIGRKLEEEQVKTNIATSEPLLKVKNLSRGNDFQDVSMTAHRGEILGIFGLMGSGRSEFFDALFGIKPSESGTIEVLGVPQKHTTPAQAKKNGLALVTEDRKLDGLVLQRSVLENVALPNLKKLNKGFFINKRRETRDVNGVVDKFQVKTPSLYQFVSRLSGGNQQKVVLAKWLLSEPKILLLDEPTRGIDVGAKREIYAFMSEFVNQNRSIIMISSELPEVMGLSDRIVVFHEGRVVADCKREDVTQEDLMQLASEGIGKKEQAI